MRVFDERNGAFAGLRDTRVLIYWPHGLGDFVHLGTILPFLEPSNTYAITRIGDDFLSMLDGAQGIRVLYTGVREIDDGAKFGVKHLGIDFKHIRNQAMDVMLPDPISTVIDPSEFDAILYTDYPEPTGRFGFPLFSKARVAIDALAGDRVDSIDWNNPLKNVISFQASVEVQARIDEKLCKQFGADARIMLLGTGGHTEPRKTWPADYERELISRWLRSDPCNAVVRFQDHALGIREDARIISLRAFCSADNALFSEVLKALLARAKIYVGVPAGPLHAAMNARIIPVVGIWQAHHPDWYDEYFANSRHLVGRWVATMGFEYRLATKTKPKHLRQSYRYVTSDIVPVDDVWREMQTLLDAELLVDMKSP